MKPAVAKAPVNNELEDVGRATLKVVHDLKNRLNGLKLYATFLRKRLERQENLQEERETVAKLIAGIDRAAGDMTVLVRYAQPIELRRNTGVDLLRIVEGVALEVEARCAKNFPGYKLNLEIEPGAFCGEFDPDALTEAFRALGEEALGRAQKREANPLSLHLSRAGTPPSASALIEWRNESLDNGSRLNLDSNRSVHAALAARIIEAHGGSVEYEGNTVRVKLPF
jgi:light-regulated signal transduction histidine kinase (bacteriophytochrome)